MLQFVLGTAGSGKTQWVRGQVKAAAEQGQEKLMLLVPEQYSFETEKAMLQLLGPQHAGCVQVMSFTRLGDLAFRHYGGFGAARLDEGGRNLFISLALEEMQQELHLFAERAEEQIPQLLSALTELKMCDIAPEQLVELAGKVPGERLQQKLRETGLILSTYDALVAQSYLDPLDDLQRLQAVFGAHAFFTGYQIYIDSFKGFTQQEFKLLGQMLEQAACVTVALTCDTLDEQGGAEVFARVRHTGHVLRRLARECGAKELEPVLCRQGVRFMNGALKTVEQQLLRSRKQPVQQQPESVVLYSAETVQREVAYVAATIRQLVMQEGYRYGEIAVIARDLEPYRGVLETTLEQYEVPYFADVPREIYTEPLMCLVLYALQILKSGFASDDVFVYLKTGLAGLDAYEISLLENYVFLWNISGRQWLEEWTAHPDGFAEVQTQQDAERLVQLNALRERLITPLRHLEWRLRSGTGETYAKGLYELLEELGAGQALQRLAERLEQAGQLQIAQQQVQLWGMLMEILDQCAGTLVERTLTLQRFAELLRLMILSYDVAGIPQSLDHVTVGTADRMRPAQPRAVFVIGAAQGVFPAEPGNTGVFSRNERKELMALGLPLSETAEEAAAEELYLGYTAMTCASERLFVSWPGAELTGQSRTPSVLVRELREIFPELLVQTETELGVLYFACTKEAAFAETARGYRSAGAEEIALKTLFLQDRDYVGCMEALERAHARAPYRFAQPASARQLFAAHRSVSATQIETYQLCPFQYFCRYGLRLKEQLPAEMDQLEYGSLIHELLQRVLQEHSAEQVAQMTPERLWELVWELTQAYLERRLGGGEEKRARFWFALRRIAETACAVILHVAKGLVQSSFVPVGYELTLGEGGDLPPLCVELPDGTTVLVEGKIDRMDVMEHNGKRYVRVVDYKTGSKDFDSAFALGNVRNGMKMQMFVYLAALAQDAQLEPAGVLYVPAFEPVVSAERGTAAEKVAHKRNQALRMNGMILDDTVVITGMEPDGQGVYLRVKLKDGVPDSASRSMLLSRQELQLVLQEVKRRIADMAQNLHAGLVEAEPLKGDYDGCEYCPYFAVCRHEETDGGKERFCRDKAQVLEEWKQEGGVQDAKMDKGTTGCD